MMAGRTGVMAFSHLSHTAEAAPETPTDELLCSGWHKKQSTGLCGPT
jgi:hypothetical protein